MSCTIGICRGVYLACIKSKWRGVYLFLIKGTWIRLSITFIILNRREFYLANIVGTWRGFCFSYTIGT
jgi:hypothetical protein